MRRVRGALAFVAIASCARAPSPVPAARPAASAASLAAAGGSAPAARASAAVPAPEPTTARYGDRAIEVACNGLDDDGDGLVDVLLPAKPNACSTGRPGACGSGYFACEGGKRACLAPPPMPEVADGVDNDCNGTVDDVTPIALRPRALVVAPRYAWADAGPDIATVSASLAQAGIPYDRQPAGTDWDKALGTLDGYTMAIVPGYLLGSAISAVAREALERFVTRGGVLIVFKPVGKSEQRQAWELCGVHASERRRDVLDLRFDGATSPATADLDSPEERTLSLNVKAAPNGVEVWLFEPDAGTEVLARAYVAGKPAGAAITRRALGKGAVYAIGHDLATTDATRCYVNCFEPSGDVMRLFFEGALREGSAGHVVLKHTTPGEASSVLLLTHDLNAPDAQNPGEWGEPGALQAARVERSRGVRATFNVTTDYVAGYFNAKTVRELCALGMCPLGAHGVLHAERFASLPDGTCAETRATYGGGSASLCGEVRVSMQLLAELTGKRPRVWRSPYLALHPRQFDVLAWNGIAFDSGFGVGDLPYNLPVDLSATGQHQDRFHQRPILEFPVACEDGLDSVEQGKHQRIELQESNRDVFAARWDYVLLRNAQNRAFTTLVLHPSRGRKAPADNLRVKMTALDGLLARAAGADVIARPLEEIGDFWRARLDASLDASFDGASYRGALVIGKTTAPGLTLEFGDAITSFTCASCGDTQVHGKRVVLASAPPAGTRAEFVAKTR